MDDTLRLIQYLYGEDVGDPSLVRRLSEDEDLRREFERLRATKAELDRRSSKQPDPAVVDRVVDAAGEAAEGAPTAADRPARAPSRSWTRRLRGISAALALLLVVGLGWWQLDGAAPGDAGSQSAQGVTQAASTEEADAVPDWDDSDELVRLHHRIERVRARSTSDWGGGLQTVNRSRP